MKKLDFKSVLVGALILSTTLLLSSAAQTATQSIMRAFRILGEVQVIARDKSLADSNIHAWSIVTQNGDGLITSDWVCPPGYNAQVTFSQEWGNVPGGFANNLHGMKYRNAVTGIETPLMTGMMLHPGDTAFFFVNWNGGPNYPGPFTFPGVMNFILIEI